MTDLSRLGEDVRYIRGLLDRPTGAPMSILVLWAALGAPGFALVDLAPAAVGWYWLAAGPLGFAASVWLGRRAAERRGQVDPGTGRRWFWHWGGLLAAVGLVVLLAAAGVVSFDVLNATIVLLVATAYFLAGVHLDRRLYWVAAALVAGLPAIIFLPRFGWTAAGALVALALLGVALSGRRAARG